MTTQVHDTGEEFAVKDLFRIDLLSKPASVEIGLFNDSTDALSDSSDIGDITTEPTGGSYARQTANFGTQSTPEFTVQDNASANWEAVIDDQTFDTADSSQDVDAYFVVVNFQASDTGDGSANDHLYFTGPLDQTYDLNSVDQFTLSGAGLEVT